MATNGTTLYPISIPQANDTQHNDAEVGCQLYLFVVNVVVIGTFCIAGLFGNALIFVVFTLDKRRTTMTFFFKALAVVDSVLLFCAFCLYSVASFRSYTDLIPNFDKVRPVFFACIYPCACTAQTAVIWITTVVGINRYIAVCRPHRAVQMCQLSQARKQVALVAVISILYNIPKWFEAKIEWKTSEDGTYSVTIVNSALSKNALYRIVYSNICYTLVLLCIPLCILSVVSLRTVHKMKEINRRRRAMMTRAAQLNHNITWVLITVCFMFIACQTPAVVNQVLWTALPYEARNCGGVQFYFSRISNALVVINSALNFFVHVSLSKEFRERLFSFCAVRDVHEDNHPMSPLCRPTAGLTVDE